MYFCNELVAEFGCESRAIEYARKSCRHDYTWVEVVDTETHRVVYSWIY